MLIELWDVLLSPVRYQATRTSTYSIFVELLLFHRDVTCTVSLTHACQLLIVVDTAKYDIEPFIKHIPRYTLEHTHGIRGTHHLLGRLRYEVSSIVLDLFNFSLEINFLKFLPFRLMD